MRAILCSVAERDLGVDPFLCGGFVSVGCEVTLGPAPYILTCDVSEGICLLGAVGSGQLRSVSQAAFG